MVGSSINYMIICVPSAGMRSLSLMSTQQGLLVFMCNMMRYLVPGCVNRQTCTTGLAAWRYWCGSIWPSQSDILWDSLNSNLLSSEADFGIKINMDTNNIQPILCLPCYVLGQSSSSMEGPVSTQLIHLVNYPLKRFMRWIWNTIGLSAQPGLNEGKQVWFFHPIGVILKHDGVFY